MIINIPPPANPAVGLERHTISYIQPLLVHTLLMLVQCLTLQFIGRHRKSIGSAQAMLCCVKHGVNYFGDDSSVLHAHL